MELVEYVKKHTECNMYIYTCLITGMCIGYWEDMDMHYNYLKRKKLI